MNYSNLGGEFLNDAIRFTDIAGRSVPATSNGEPTVRDALGPAHTDPAGAELASAVFELNGYVHGPGCVPLAHADIEARRLLDRAGFAHWSVEWHPETGDQRCASFTVDADAETIHLLPIATSRKGTPTRPPGRSNGVRPEVAVHPTRPNRVLLAKDQWRRAP